MSDTVSGGDVVAKAKAAVELLGRALDALREVAASPIEESELDLYLDLPPATQELNAVAEVRFFLDQSRVLVEELRQSMGMTVVDLIRHRAQKYSEIEPGYQKLLELAGVGQLVSRGATDAELAEAIRPFMVLSVEG